MMADEPFKAEVTCMRCGWHTSQNVDPQEDKEWICPKCGSNSIRIKALKGVGK